VAFESEGAIEFQADELLAGNYDDCPVCGLNITVGWPLPIESSYRDFARSMSDLDPGVFVYPFEQTHITVLTALNFRLQMNPTPSDVRLVEEAAERLGEFVQRLGRGLLPFVISVGSPVLTSRAAFLSVSNASGEIEMIRQEALGFCLGDGGLLGGAQAPSIVHSTFLRFRRPPKYPKEFAAKFREIGDRTRLGSGPISEVLVALETKPYMREGRVIRRIGLHMPKRTLTDTFEN
jgi:hypothetical protein